jgi:hypothetical protein
VSGDKDAIRQRAALEVLDRTGLTRATRQEVSVAGNPMEQLEDALHHPTEEDLKPNSPANHHYGNRGRGRLPRRVASAGASAEGVTHGIFSNQAKYSGLGTSCSVTLPSGEKRIASPAMSSIRQVKPYTDSDHRAVASI